MLDQLTCDENGDDPEEAGEEYVEGAEEEEEPAHRGHAPVLPRPGYQVVCAHKRSNSTFSTEHTGAGLRSIKKFKLSDIFINGFVPPYQYCGSGMSIPDPGSEFFRS